MLPDMGLLAITRDLVETDRFDLDDARWALGEATRRLAPSPELSGWWEGYDAVAMAFAAGQNVCAHSMLEMRRTLEYVRSDDPIADSLIATSKMVLSAVVLFTVNPTGGLLAERDEIHDDLDPLVRKAVEILHGVAVEVDDADVYADGNALFLVEFDAEHPKRINERNERNRLKWLIDNAVRPN
jgi:hypothetical protein